MVSCKSGCTMVCDLTPTMIFHEHHTNPTTTSKPILEFMHNFSFLISCKVKHGMDMREDGRNDKNGLECIVGVQLCREEEGVCWGWEHKLNWKMLKVGWVGGWGRLYGGFLCVEDENQREVRSIRGWWFHVNYTSVRVVATLFTWWRRWSKVILDVFGG